MRDCSGCPVDGRTCKYADIALYYYLRNSVPTMRFEPEQSDDIGSYRGMLWGTDRFVGQLTALLKEKEMYEDTLVVFSAGAPPPRAFRQPALPVRARC